jgi:hypothetical protein
LSGFTLALLILSHQAVALIGLPFLLAFSLVFCFPRHLLNWFHLIGTFLVGLLLSSYYWLPALIEARYTHQTQYLQAIDLLAPLELFYSPWRFGLLYQGPQGELALLLGYIQWFIIIIGGYIVIKRNLSPLAYKLLLFSLICLCLTLFMTTSLSASLWQIIPLIKHMQFSYRLLNITLILISLITSYVAHTFFTPIKFSLLFFLLIFPTILNWGNRRMIPQSTDQQFIHSLPLITAQSEGLAPAAPIWTDPAHPWLSQIPANHMETISGDLSILAETRTILSHKYQVRVNTSTLVKENTLYFPGWQLFDNGQPVAINPSYPGYPGVITFTLPPGIHAVNLVFVDTPIRRLSLTFSLVTLIVVMGLLLSRLSFTNIGRWLFSSNHPSK